MVIRPKINNFLKATLCTTCIHLKVLGASKCMHITWTRNMFHKMRKNGTKFWAYLEEISRKNFMKMVVMVWFPIRTTSLDLCFQTCLLDSRSTNLPFSGLSVIGSNFYYPTLLVVLSERSNEWVEPRVATQPNNYMGLVQTFHKGIDYVSNYLDLRLWKEKWERSIGEKLGRELWLGLTSQNNLDDLQIIFCLYII